MKLLKATLQNGKETVHEVQYGNWSYDWYADSEYVAKHGIRIGYY